MIEGRIGPITGSARWLGVGLGLGLLVACNAGSTGDDGFDFSTESNGSDSAGTTGGTADDTAGSSGPGSEGSTGEGEGSSTGEGADSSTGEPPPPAEPCTAIDMLLVVDNSEPMLEEQLRLLGTGLAFVQAVQESIPTLMEDIQIGVITTDDEVMVQPSGMGCPVAYEGGLPWMLSSSTALQAELECALTPGADGSPNERPMDMLVGALSDENLQPGGAHSGFLRENALLVVVLLTNEEDELEEDTAWGSAGDPPDWATAVADRKGGWAHDVVVLSLLGTPKPNACPDFQWDGTEGAQVSPRLIEFTESFPQGAVGDICAPEYATFMLGVVPGVAAACAAYTPP